MNLREEQLIEPLNGWIGRLSDREHIDQTVAELVGSQGDDGAAEHQAAIAAGVGPTALVEVINAAQAERGAARAALASAGNVQMIDRAEVYAMIDSLGDVGATLKDAKPAGLARLYEELRLQIRYEHQEQAVYVAATPRVIGERVRWGTETRILR